MVSNIFGDVPNQQFRMTPTVEDKMDVHLVVLAGVVVDDPANDGIQNLHLRMRAGKVSSLLRFHCKTMIGSHLWYVRRESHPVIHRAPSITRHDEGDAMIVVAATPCAHRRALVSGLE